MRKFLSFVISIVIIFAVESCKDIPENVPYKLIISCDEIVEFIDDEVYGIKSEKRELVPDDGIILELEDNCSEGDNVYNCVTNNLKSKKLHFQGTDGYISAIGNIYAGDCGEFSGWMLFINGELAELGASDTIIQENDVIEFKYIVDYNTLFN